MRVAAFIPPPCAGGGNGVRGADWGAERREIYRLPSEGLSIEVLTCAMPQPKPQRSVGKSQRM
jgi:hypothetical protein